MIKKMNKTILTFGIAVMAVFLMFALCSCGGDKSKSNSGSDSKQTVNYSKDDFKQTDAVEIEVANYGKIKVGLDANAAPITVENFKKLVNQGFYNGLTFHRIIDKFMMQGGDPKGDGTGGSPDTIKGEFSENGVKNTLAHTRGAISMARSQSKDSASSQFFIVHQTSDNNSKSLDGKYCCFGYVLEGMEIVDQIIANAHPTDNNGTIPRDQQPVITSIKMV